jgi:hypothetical protein
MTANILTAFQDRGVKFWLDGPHLKFAAPRGLLDRADLATLSQHKLELLALLSGPSNCCCCDNPLPPGMTYRCPSCEVPTLPRVTAPCLVNGGLRIPTGYQLTGSLYDLAVSLGMSPELAARRYVKRGER